MIPRIGPTSSRAVSFARHPFLRLTRTPFLIPSAVTGTLKGFDQLLNLVLDECEEYLRDPEDPLKVTDQTRTLGLLVCRGTSVMVVSGLDGMEELANPFLAPEGEMPAME